MLPWPVVHHCKKVPYTTALSPRTLSDDLRNVLCIIDFCSFKLLYISSGASLLAIVVEKGLNGL